MIKTYYIYYSPLDLLRTQGGNGKSKNIENTIIWSKDMIDWNQMTL